MEGKLQVHDLEINTLFWADDIVMFTRGNTHNVKCLTNTKMKINWK